MLYRSLKVSSVVEEDVSKKPYVEVHTFCCTRQCRRARYFQKVDRVTVSKLSKCRWCDRSENSMYQRVIVC